MFSFTLIRSLGSRWRVGTKAMLLLFLVWPFWSPPAASYDNSRPPPFEMEKEKRGFSWLSIHPDGERWLITECTDRLGQPLGSCYLFLYNRQTQLYQRYDLDPHYMYADGQFSPDGDTIVAVRRPLPTQNTHEEKHRVYVNGEILLMGVDGSDLRVLPIPKGFVKRPALSPDGTKVAYWRAATARPPGAKTWLADFDLWEFDLASGENRLFAGEHRFFLANGVQYTSSDEVLVNADSPTSIPMSIFEYHARYGYNQVYVLKRGVRELPPPAYTEVKSVRTAAIANKNRIYLLGEPPPHGISIVEMAENGARQRWRVPYLTRDGISSVFGSPREAYLLFIYPSVPLRSSSPATGIGMVDLQQKRWLPISLDQPELALPLIPEK